MFHLTGSGFQRVLVRTGSNLQSFGLLVIAQPSPARSLYGHRSRFHFLLEVVQSLQVAIQQFLQLGRRIRPIRREILPENGMVDVATAVELEGTTQLNDLGSLILGDGFLQLLLGGVQIRNVGIVVLLVVNL